MLSPDLLENIDDMSLDPKDLDIYADNLQELSKTFTGDDSRIARKLSSYARWKAQAMRYRLSGQIVSAKCIEDVCDQIYKSLPNYARW